MNKIMIVSLILLAVLTLGAVSASDNLTASETPDLDELGVSDADIIEESDVGDEIYSEGEYGEDEYKEDLCDYWTYIEESYLAGEENMFGVGIEDTTSGNISISIDSDVVYSGSVIKYNYDLDGPSTGGNFINLDDLNLEYGSHDYVIDYTGDSYYYARMWEGTFEYNYIILIVPDEIMFGSDDVEQTRIFMDIANDATGNITVLIDNRPFYSKSVADARNDEGFIEIFTDNLTFESHNYTISYTGNYPDFSESGSFNMSYRFDVIYEEGVIFLAGDRVDIDVRLPSDVTSTPIATIGDESYEMPYNSDSGTYQFVFSDYGLGDNIVQISYQDDKYPFKAKNITIPVEYCIECMGVVNYNTTSNPVYLYLPRNANGNLVVNINGEDKKVKVVDGKAKFFFNNYTIGYYNIVISYDGDDYAVEPEEHTVEIIADVQLPPVVWINGDYNVTIVLPPDLTSNLTVRIYDYEWASMNVPTVNETIYEGPAAGTTTVPLPISALSAGEMYKCILWLDDAYHCDSRFLVRSESPEWNLTYSLPEERLRYPYYDVAGPDYVYGPKGMDGTLTLYFDGEYATETSFYSDVDYDYSFAYLGVPYSELSYGMHTWRLEFTGDSYFNDVTKEGTIDITWYQFPEVITYGGGIGTAYVCLAPNQEHTVTLLIDGEEFDSKSSIYGEFAFDIYNFDYGEHSYTIICTGDEQLNATGTFTVETYIVFGEIEDYPYGDVTEYSVEVPSDATGTVTVSVDGENYTADVEDGVAFVLIPNLDWGEHPITVFYSGDENYLPVSGEGIIRINKYGVVAVKEDGILKEVSLKLPADATGNLTLKINNELYESVPVEDGYAKIVLGDFEAGYVNAYAYYSSENYDYYAESKFASFAVLPEMNITDEICEGDDCIIEIELPDATGQLEIYVDYELYGTYDPVDGRFDAVISDLEAGEYTITFKYLGDEYYHLFTSYYDEDMCEEELMEFRVYVNGDEEEDGPLDLISFDFVGDDDEPSFEIGNDVTIAYLLIPCESDDVDVTVTVTKNGQPFATMHSTEIEKEYIESLEAYKYPINMDLTQLEDKDILEFNIDFFVEENGVLTYTVEINGDEAIFHYYIGALESYVFYGNITIGDLNSPEMMGPHPNGNFIEFAIPDEYGVTEGSIVVSDGDTVILNKSLDEFENVGFDYSILGNSYAITLDEFDLMSLPENKVITVTFNYGSDSITAKRVRVGDYVSILVTPDDVARLFDIEISDEIPFDATNENNTILSIVATDDANRQSIYIDIGAGQFKVYVNDEEVEGLGEKILDNWIVNSGILEEDDEGYLEESGIDPDVYLSLDEDGKIQYLHEVKSEDFANGLQLFRLCSVSQGCRELYLTAQDLGITENGMYTIRITHIPDEYEQEEPEPGEPYYLPDDYIVHEETLVLEKNVTVMFEPIETILSGEDLEMRYKDGSAWEICLTDIYGNTINGVNVAFNILNKTYNRRTDENGVAGLTINLARGTYDITATFEGNDNYESSSVSAVVTVINTQAILNATDLVMAPKDGSAWNVTVTDSSGKALAKVKIAFTISSATFEKTYKITADENGVASLPIGLGVGVYNVTAVFEGTAKIDSGSVSATITVRHPPAVLTAEDLVMAPKSGSAWNVTLIGANGNPIAGAVIKFSIVNKTYKIKTDENGVASLPIGLSRGVYEVSATFDGDSQNGPASINATVTVKYPTNLAAEDLVMTYNDGSEYTVTLTDSNGAGIANNVVKVTINGKTYNRRTNDDGVATLPIGLAPGTYEVTASFEEDSYYAASETTSNVTVNRA